MCLTQRNAQLNLFKIIFYKLQWGYLWESERKILDGGVGRENFGVSQYGHPVQLTMLLVKWFIFFFSLSTCKELTSSLDPFVM